MVLWEMETEILDEGRWDWVSFAVVAQIVGAYECSEHGPQALSWRAVEVVSGLVLSGDVVAGDLTPTGFHPWPGEPHEVVERIRRTAADVIAPRLHPPRRGLLVRHAGAGRARAPMREAYLAEDMLGEARRDWIDMGHAMGLVHDAEGGEDQLALLRRAGALIVGLVRDGRCRPGEFVPWPLAPATAAQALEEYLDEVLSGAKPVEPWQPCLFAVTGYNDELPDGRR